MINCHKLLMSAGGTGTLGASALFAVVAAAAAAAAALREGKM